MNYNSDFPKTLAEKLANLKANNLYRQPKTQTGEDLNFCSNDYLGLSQNNFLKKAAIDAINKYGVGASSSRYISSNNSLYQELEKSIAELKNCPDAIVLGSGYLTGVGVIPALVGKDDLIIADRLIHSSLIDGCKLSQSKFLRFQHNNLAHCQKLLEEYRVQFKQCLIVTETVFSMDGDLGKVSELIKLAKKYHCLLMTDDAHGLGIVKQKYQKYDGHLQCGTLSKAAGGYGGYAAGSKLMIDYLRNFTKTAIYSTALPAAILASNLQAINLIKNDNKLAKKALANAEYFCQLPALEIIGLKKPSSPIIPIIIGDVKKTLTIAKKLQEQGFLISAIRPPTVEAGKSRLRITFSAFHQKSDIKRLANCLIKLLKK